MCGRFSLTSTLKTLQESFQLTESFYMHPRYNIAPTNKILVQTKPHTIDFFTWGFKTKWLDEKGKKEGYINARAENILEKPLFRQAIRKRRCLVFANGFYEWKQEYRQKQPYFIRRKDKAPFAFAGIFEDETVAIITTEANSLLTNIHSRMPVILEPKDYGSWLDLATDIDQIVLLLKPAFSEAFEYYPVSFAVNKPDFDNMLCNQSLQV